MERRLINASSRGSLTYMTPTEIWGLIEKLAIDSKHSANDEEWYPDQPRGVKEINNAHLKSQIYELTKAVLLLTKEKGFAKKRYGIFLKTEHPTDMYPLLQEDVAPVKSVERYQQQKIFN